MISLVKDFIEVSLRQSFLLIGAIGSKPSIIFLLPM
jgi:hypothetical protein